MKAHNLKLKDLILTPENSKDVVKLTPLKKTKKEKEVATTVNTPPVTPLVSNVEENISQVINHPNIANKIYGKVRRRITALIEYFRLNTLQSGIVVNRTINDEYSTIKIKFLYTHKKAMIIIFNDRIEVGYYTRTNDIVKDIETPYILSREIEIGTYEEVKDKISNIFFWGINEESKEKFNRAFAVTINKDNSLIENRLHHVLYYGLIESHKLLEETEDGVKYEFTFIHDKENKYVFTLTKDNSIKMNVGQILVINAKDKMNIFNFKGVRSLIDFSSLDYKNLSNYSISAGGNNA